MTTTFYFLVEKGSVCIIKKLVSVNSKGHDPDASFV